MKFEQHYEAEDWLTITEARKVAHMTAKRFRDVLGHLIHPGAKPHSGLVNYGELNEELKNLPHYKPEK